MDIRRRGLLKRFALSAASLAAGWFARINPARAAEAGEKAVRAIDLAGVWQVRLRGSGDGSADARSYEAALPGSLTSNGLGDAISLDTPWMGFTGRGGWATADKYAPYRRADNLRVPFWLQPDTYYKGKAWYRRQVEIPEYWRGKRIHLELERCHWETSVLVDGRAAGGRESLCVPHVYDLSDGLTPGRHELSICVDNDYHVRVGYDAHSVTDHTQTNWNGIVGEMRLRARRAVSGRCADLPRRAEAQRPRGGANRQPQRPQRPGQAGDRGGLWPDRLAGGGGRRGRTGGGAGL